MRAIEEGVRTYGGKALPLKVAGAFHSRLMQEAEKKFSQYLIKVDFNTLRIPVVSNVEARKVRDPEDIKAALVRQTSSPILWWQSMKHFADCDLVVEVGPNTKFSRMLKREWPERHIMSINTQQDIDNLLALIEFLSRNRS